ncbi:hypothetical protein M1437_01890 [Patescibacteria group bacterium]|nr:hypothetical protein [Patescibacteria group bacterium]
MDFLLYFDFSLKYLCYHFRMEVREMENDKRQMNPLAAGLAGAIIGAGVAAATSRVLSDKKSREKAKEVAFGLRDKAGMLLRGGAEMLFHHKVGSILRGKESSDKGHNGERKAESTSR